MKKIFLCLLSFVFLFSLCVSARYIGGFSFYINKSGGNTAPLIKQVSRRNAVVNMDGTSSKHHFWVDMKGYKNKAKYSSIDIWGSERKILHNNAEASNKGNKQSYYLTIGRKAGLFDNGKIKAVGSWSPDEK
ncbi:MAG: hypothetical protein LBR15_02485 [Methanobrevibacter sp.]|nr:hypothetical protein [Candidatus Methanovirga australis]